MILHRIPSLAIAGALLCALTPVSLAQGADSLASEPTWSLVRPGNTGIPGDYTFAMLLDANDQPWVGGVTPFYEEGGMAHWDGDTWFTVSNVDHPVIASPRFNDMVSDASGLMWIGTDLGLIRFDPAVGPDSLTRWDTANSPILVNRIRDLDIAPDGSIWMALKEYSGPGGLARFDPATNEWSAWTTTNGLPWGTQWPGWNFIDFVGVAPDAGGGYTVWFGSKEMGVGTWEAGVFAWFGMPVLSAGAPTYPHRLLGTDATDAAGHVWMLTNNGLARRNPDASYDMVAWPAGVSTNQVLTVQAFEGGRAGLGTFGGDVFRYEDGSGWTSLGNWGGGYGTFTYAVKEASDGVVWAAGTGGAGRLEAGQWQRYGFTNTGLIGYETYSIDFAPDGKVYIGDHAAPGIGGFSILDGQHWTCVNDANTGLGPAWGLPGDNASALTVLANGHLILSPGLGQGLVEWDGADYTYLVPQGYEIRETTEDLTGGVWAARDNFGVFKVKDGVATQYTWANSPLLPGLFVDLVADEANAGFVWIVTTVGVSHTDGDTWVDYPRELLGLTSSSGADFINCGDVADDGTLWLGTGVGLYHLDPTDASFEVWNKHNSPLPSATITKVEVAPDGSVWASSRDDVFPYPGGLSHFDGTGWQVYSAGSSPLPHDQIEELNSRPTPTGYELWVGMPSQAIAVLDVEVGQSAWSDQGGALAGSAGEPLLVGIGNLAPGSSNSVDLSNAAPSALAAIFLATSSTPVPFKGGVLKPVPFLPPAFVTTSASGTLDLPFAMPAVVPTGAELWVQWAVQDAAAVYGVSLSNAIQGVVP